MTFVSGPYRWFGSARSTDTNLLSLGVVEDAPELRVSTEADPITGDNLGGMVQGFINRGANVFLSLVFQEWDGLAAQRIFWPYSSPGTATSGSFETGANQQTNPPSFTAIGCVTGYQNDPSKSTTAILVAQKEEFSCANPARYYALGATLAPGSDYSYLLGSRLKNVGVTMQLLPWVDSAPTSPQAPTSDPTLRVTHVYDDKRVKCWAEGAIPGS